MKLGQSNTILVALFCWGIRLLGNFEHRFRDLCTAGALSGPREELAILLLKRGIDNLIIVLKCSCTFRAERGIGNFNAKTWNWPFYYCTHMLVHFQGQTRNWQFYYLSRIEKRNISILPFLRLSPQILTIGGGNIPNDAIPSWKHEESTSVALLSPVCLFSILSIPTEGGTYPGWGCGLDMSNPPMKEAPVISNGWWGILNYVALSDCSWEKINYIKMYLIFQHFRSYFDVTRYNWITKPEVYILQMEQVYFPNFFCSRHNWNLKNLNS